MNSKVKNVVWGELVAGQQCSAEELAKELCTVESSLSCQLGKGSWQSKSVHL